jgi:DNA-binding transcriptional LysR family regulator
MLITFFLVMSRNATFAAHKHPMNNAVLFISIANIMKHPIELKTLRTFVTVAQLGSVTRAAEALHMTQPALSLRLKQLAQDTGLTLFRRNARGLELTLDGLTFHIKAMQVTQALRELEQTARHLSGSIRGRLRIGTIIDPEFTRLGAVLRTLVEAAPHLEKELRQGMSGNVADWIAQGDIDAGFYLGDIPVQSTASGEPLFTHLHLATFAYWVIAPQGWESRVLGRDWAGLAQLPWIGAAPASAHTRLLQSTYANEGISPNFVALIDQESSMLAMVRSGVGLSLCRDSVALTEQRRHGLVVSDRCQLPCSLSFIALHSRRQEKSIACAFDAVSTAWGGGL